MSESKLSTRSVRVFIAAILALGIAAALAVVGVNASASTTAGDEFVMSSKSYGDYPKNPQGKAFGSALEAKTPADEPDLILAQGTNGKIGYILKSDARGPEPRTPAEAIALTNQKFRTQEPQTSTIPLYSEDGVTVIGEYLIN